MNFFYFKSTVFIMIHTLLLVLMIAFPSGTADAHRVVIFAWMEGDTVYTESRFPDGGTIADAVIKVYDMQNNLLLEGKTDDNGEFSFKIPKASALNIVLEAGMGHQGQWQLTEAEVKSAMGAGKKTPPPETNEAPEHVTGNAEPAKTSPASGLLISEQQLEQIIEKALDKKIHPIAQMLAQMQDKGPSANDIFGGIGYILGLMGVGAVILSRKKND